MIEDDADGREMLRTWLTLAWHEVDDAADGVEGIGRALSTKPDVVFIDIGLPKLDG